MAHVQVLADHVDLESPVLVEGLPGAGLVGKIACDHLVDAFEMQLYGTLHCEGLPKVAVYQAGAPNVMPPVRLYADEERDLLALQADVPVSPTQAENFADCITGWIDAENVFPLYLSGLPEEKGDVPELYGITTGNAADVVEDVGLQPPKESGMVTGPTGALLNRAAETNLDAVGLIVQAEAQFPDPEAARVLIEDGIEPIADVDVDTDELLARADEIQEAREEFAQRMQQADDESTQAQSIRMFQ